MSAFNRRSLLSGIAAAGAVAMSQPLEAAVSRKGFFARIRKPIGIQVYTLGDEAGKDLAGTFHKLAAIGYRDLELPQLFGKSPAEVRAAADAAGVRISAIHLAAMPNIPASALSMNSPAQRIADDLGTLGASAAVLPLTLLPSNFRPKPGMGMLEVLTTGIAEGGADPWLRSAALLNEKAAALKPHGIAVGYHNHNIEFAPVGATTGWGILMKEFDPALVKLEIDIGWVVAGGHDPVAFLRRHNGRVRWLHVKDVKPSTQTNFALKMDPTEVGSGKLDWARILPAAHAAGVEHFYLEQEPPFTMARIDAAAKGHAFLSALKA